MRRPALNGPAGPYPVTRSPLDWHPLAGADPVPGEPWAVHDLARRMALTAELARTQARTLGVPGTFGWHGPAAEAFAGVVVELSPLLDRVADRYAGAAEALTTYANALRQAQDQARGALTAARAPAPDAAAAARLLTAAVSARECAATAAAVRLAAVAQDGLRDQASLGRLLGRAVHAAADFAVNTAHLDEVSALLGVAAMATAWCPPVGGTLQIGALATGGLALAARLELRATGSPGGSNKEVLTAAIGVTLTGVGRIYGASAKAAVAVGRAERAVATAGADTAALAQAQAALAVIRAQLPRHPLVPRLGHLAEASPHRLVRDVRASWDELGTPGTTLANLAQRSARETGEVLSGKYGAAAAANSTAQLTLRAESSLSDLGDLRAMSSPRSCPVRVRD